MNWRKWKVEEREVAAENIKKNFFMENCTFKKYLFSITGSLVSISEYKKNVQIKIFLPLFHFKLNISSIIENHDGCIYIKSEWISCCRKTSPMLMMMILSTQTLHFLSAWCEWTEEKLFYFFFSLFFFNFNFLLHVSLSLLTSCCLSFFDEPKLIFKQVLTSFLLLKLFYFRL